MNEQLKHIFDKSACLSQRQMKDYVRGVMTNEESHAVEVHLNCCPFCSDAIDGMFAKQEGDVVGVMATMNSDFLKEHFSLSNPEIHLNSIAAAQPVLSGRTRRRKVKSVPLWRTVSIAALILITLGAVWFVSNSDTKSTMLGSADVTSTEKKGDVTQNTAYTISTQDGSESELAESREADNTPRQDMQANDNSQRPLPLVAGNQDEEKVDEEKAKVEEKKRHAVAQKVADTKQEGFAAAKSVAETKEETRSKTKTQQADMSAATSLTAANDAEAGLRKRADMNAGSTVVNATMEKEEISSESLMQQADAMFSNKNYMGALGVYKRQMSSGEKAARQEATLKAAQCYLALGDKTKARGLLEGLVNDGNGREKREAKRLLKTIE